MPCRDEGDLDRRVSYSQYLIRDTRFGETLMMPPERREQLTSESAAWPGFRVMVTRAELDRFVQPPNGDTRHQFLDMLPLIGADGQEIGVMTVAGEANESGETACVVRWDPAGATSNEARRALDQALGRQTS